MRRSGVVLLAVALAFLTACSRDRDPVEEAVVRPNMIMDFGFLYAKNCAGCHGKDGKGGVAIALGRSGLPGHRRRCHYSARYRQWGPRNVHACVRATRRRNVDRRSNQCCRQGNPGAMGQTGCGERRSPALRTQNTRRCETRSGSLRYVLLIVPRSGRARWLEGQFDRGSGLSFHGERSKSSYHGYCGPS